MLKHLFFRRGKVKKGSGSKYPKPRQGEHLLLFMTRPTQDEIKQVTTDFGIEPGPLQTYHKETHSRRYIAKPFQFVMRTAFVEGSGIGFTNLLFVLSTRVLVVATSKPSEFYEEVLEDIAESFTKIEARSVGHILYNFLQEDVDENYEVLGLIERQIKDVEAKASRLKLRETRLKVDDILMLKNRLFRLSRQFWATTRVISLIRIGVAQVYIDKESERLFGDVHETFLHQIDLAAAQKEMVSDALNVYATTLSNIAAIQSNELNIVMKKLTAYASILLVPTLIASVYGMNFAHIPLSEHAYGFYMVVGMMVVFTGIMLANFIKNDWL